MAKGQRIAGFKPGTFEVRNSSKRRRVRGQFTFPGRGKASHSSTTVQIRNAREFLQINACRDLEVSRVAGGSGSSGGSGRGRGKSSGKGSGDGGKAPAGGDGGQTPAGDGSSEDSGDGDSGDGDSGGQG